MKKDRQLNGSKEKTKTINKRQNTMQTTKDWLNSCAEEVQSVSYSTRSSRTQVIIQESCPTKNEIKKNLL
jgi:hypothetical protein